MEPEETRVESWRAWLRELPARARRRAGSQKSTYWLTRFVFLRGLGLVYFAAFLSLAHQLLPLLGSEGLLPVPLYLERLIAHQGGEAAALRAHPSLFLIDASDGVLLSAAYLGVAASLSLLVGFANAPLLALLWVLYLSFVNVGQTWFSFGWEYQLLETGFLAIFLCPLLDARPFPRRAPPRAVIWLLRWLIFRLMLGAGLIKLRGDPCWADLTCLFYHYETQPIPHPLSWFHHNMPGWFHSLGVLFSHSAELIAPFFVFGPRRARHIAGGVLVLFQLILISSGNLAFLNWLTLVTTLVCFDDALLKQLLPTRLTDTCTRAAQRAVPSRAQGVSIALLAVTVAVLSIAPAKNLLSSRQVMNTSYGALHLVNSYGHFGGITRERYEIVLLGTSDPEPGPASEWREYAWKCKPGDLLRRPCFITPYHNRLDWLIWFAAMSGPDRHPWVVHLMWKLLHNDSGALSLLAGNPFPDQPPRFVKADLYLYAFTDYTDPGDAWWKREWRRTYVGPLSRDAEPLQRFLRRAEWLD